MKRLGLNSRVKKTILRNARIPNAVIEIDRISVKTLAVTISIVGYRITITDKL